MSDVDDHIAAGSATYSPSSRQAEQIAALVSAGADERKALIDSMLAGGGAVAVASMLFHVIGMANSVAANCREWIATELIVKDLGHPDEVDRINTPSMLGAALGARKSAQVSQQGLCAGCALRLGSIANQSASTQADVDYVERGAGVFRCHLEGLDTRGVPTRACPGWARWQALNHERASAADNDTDNTQEDRT